MPCGIRRRWVVGVLAQYRDLGSSPQLCTDLDQKLMRVAQIYPSSGGQGSQECYQETGQAHKKDSCGEADAAASGLEPSKLGL